jgi:ribonuclease P protein component
MFPSGYDYVIVARAGAYGRAFKELLVELSQLLKRMVAGHAGH